jgi:hypothetical protein
MAYRDGLSITVSGFLMSGALPPLLPQVVAQLKGMLGVVDIDSLPNHPPTNKAGYLAEGGSIITKQKELRAYSLNYERNYKPAIETIIEKYGVDNVTGLPNCSNMSDDEAEKFKRSLMNEVDALKDRIHDANKQIQGTKDAAAARPRRRTRANEPAER